VDDLTRAFEFERRWFERCSTRLERFEFGVAYLDEDYRQRYFSNFPLADRTLNGASVEALIEAAERILGDAGCEHRLIILRDERWAERFAPAFNALGFSTSREVTMTHRRGPDRDADLPVELVPFAVVRPLIEEMYVEDPNVPDDVALLFTEQQGKYERSEGRDSSPHASMACSRATASSTRTEMKRRSNTLAPSSGSAAEESLAPSSCEPSRRRGTQARGTSSSSPTKKTGHGTSTHDSVSIRSDARGSSSGRRSQRSDRHQTRAEPKAGIGMASLLPTPA
jgi:hypothetical protein